ncbi:MAG: branched-chain amino acid ABC transporter permease [Chloroflexi bacterium]|nr:branched-chain amino acid ABC transporter permease [Chloroflexota bacterium]MCY3583645.1 branched-chain amino acid ABC transporter permease [Chloroflexota bacterium]MCY3715525.1 branched-chain amino acid ABC transporter permease [Chloroflexota bacterium]MDE2650258.1 branched-chain amino acid ABC transporter permease [Chloroflexota bacterium]MXV93158.1 branched-chain amino acid ABC transporter permease [Chloroflexota bacterium]
MNEWRNRYSKQLTWALCLAGAVLLLLFLGDQLAGKKAARIVQTLISGVLVGGVYGLVALGIVVINKASGVFNFAHGWMMVVGGMIFWSFFTVSEISIPGALLLATATMLMIMTTAGYRALLQRRNLLTWLGGSLLLTVLMTIGGSDWQWLHALTGTAAGAILTGLAVERFAIRPLIGQPLFTAVLMTLAIAEVLHGITQLVWGTVELNLPIFVDPSTNSRFKPIRLDAFREALGGVAIIRVELVIAFVLAILAFIGFILFFRYTSVGLAMRATSEDQQLAQAVGLRVRVILAITWATAAFLASIAGVLQGGAVGLSLNISYVALRVFPAVLLGGLESISGALLGGIIIGIVEQFGTLINSSEQVGTNLAPYVVLMLALIIRPDGLFGEKRIERI